MREIEMIKTMVNMQKALDEAIYKTHSCEYDFEKSKLALYDEIGEMVHELKGSWCWWKKTQKPVDRAKVLEELVDCWHFGMSIDYHSEQLDDTYRFLETNFDYCVQSGKFNKLSVLISYIDGVLNIYKLIEITYNLGFTMEDVYNGYILKNAENYKRLKGGY